MHLTYIFKIGDELTDLSQTHPSRNSNLFSVFYEKGLFATSVWPVGKVNTLVLIETCIFPSLVTFREKQNV